MPVYLKYDNVEVRFWLVVYFFLLAYHKTYGWLNYLKGTCLDCSAKLVIWHFLYIPTLLNFVCTCSQFTLEMNMFNETTCFKEKWDDHTRISKGRSDNRTDYIHTMDGHACLLCVYIAWTYKYRLKFICAHKCVHVWWHEDIHEQIHAHLHITERIQYTDKNIRTHIESMFHFYRNVFSPPDL